MKRREFLRSATFAAVAAGLKGSAKGIPSVEGSPLHTSDESGASGSKSPVGIRPTSNEIEIAHQWFEKHLNHRADSPPFSFVYGAVPSSSLFATWPMKVWDRRVDDRRRERMITWSDAKTGLDVRCVAVTYSDFPVVEWTVYFRNNGQENTPVIENIEGLRTTFERSKDAEFVLHQNRGDSNIAESYQPSSGTLLPNTTEVAHPVGGRPTDTGFPYFNLQAPDGGTIIAVGWPGQWAATFKRDADRSLAISAGQELTHLYLKPGEEIRAPLIALLFWQGADGVRAQNIWRRWMLTHNLPRPGGKQVAPIGSFCDGAFFPGLKVSEAGEKEFIDALERQHLKFDHWWIDAGWYPCGDNWENTGTWEPDPIRFPHGIKAVSDYLHARGTKLIVWFEPERATAGSWLALNHPDWLLGGKLLNMSRPEVREWITNRVDKLIAEQGIDLYRQDFNIQPLNFWRDNDEPNRQGITENFYVQGYLAHLDELRLRHPDMLIDSCASGGRRNDLETMRRAVPLLRSDYSPYDGNAVSALGNQGHTYGISSWLPYYGQGAYVTRQDPIYYMRSHMCPAFGMPVDVRGAGVDWDMYRTLVTQWRSAADCMLGDYYPLSPYNLQIDQWIAWQFDRPENGDGIVQAFRRPDSDQASMTFRLQGVEPATKYEVTDLDTRILRTLTGDQLLAKGFVIEIKEKPGSALLKYKKKVN